MIKSSLSGKREGRGKMDKWLNNNNISKIIALVISIILWGMVHMDSGTTTITPSIPSNNGSKVIDNVQVQVVGFDEDKYVLYGLEPEKVRIEVRGKRTNITTNFSSYKVKLDLSHAKSGTMMMPLTHELPSGVEFVSMEPSMVKVTIEAKKTQEIEANVITKGKISEGYQIGIPVIKDGGKVNVTLPESRMEQLGKVQGIFDVTGMTEPVKGKSVRLVAYDKDGNEMTDAELSPATLDVDIPIMNLYKSIPLSIRQSGKLPSGYVLADMTSDVEGVAVYGPKEVLDKLNSYSVTIDLDQFQSGTTKQYFVNLTPPEGSEKIEPSSVNVTIKVEPVDQKVIQDIPITFINPNSALTPKMISPTTEKISLTLQGATHLLDGVSAKDIKINVNLNGLGAGKHVVPIEVVLPHFVELAEGEKGKKIEVELESEQDTPTTTTPNDGQNSGGNQTDKSPDNTGENNQSGQNAG
jgi:YbbR domain-containing protein